jgi:ketol-acid reductoisomerase
MMSENHAQIFFPEQRYRDRLAGKTVAVIGYGNQGRAQALNLRDNGIRVVIGNRDDSYQQQARMDGFETFHIPDAAAKGDYVMLLLPDEVLPRIFGERIRPSLNPGVVLSFASGYTIAHDLLKVPTTMDVILIAPRMIGVGVRERFLTQEGFYCFIGVHQDASGKALDHLLALTDCIGGLIKPAIEVTFKQETLLDLFDEQAFGPAFGRVLLTSISVLIQMGIPPEAALVEMYLSEEMAYTYRKMAQVGLVKQTLFHSHTSQYGAMSRGIRFMDLDLRGRMEKIYHEIESGEFAREWQNPISRLKFKAIRFFAMRQFINKVEAQVRRSLGLKDATSVDDEVPHQIHEILENPEIKDEIESFKDAFEF